MAVIDGGVGVRAQVRRGSRLDSRALDIIVNGRAFPVTGERLGITILCGPGGDLLFHALRRSTIGASAFHGRVRDGTGWVDAAITTKPAKDSFRDR